MTRRIVEIARGTGKLGNTTFVKLDCGHERGIGGHVLADGSRPMIGESYDCRDGMCSRKAA